MSKESTVTPMGGLWWIVKEACTRLGLGAGGWFGELMPPPHPTSRTAKETSNTEQEVNLRTDVLLPGTPGILGGGLLLDKIYTYRILSNAVKSLQSKEEWATVSLRSTYSRYSCF